MTTTSPPTLAPTPERVQQLRDQFADDLANAMYQPPQWQKWPREMLALCDGYLAQHAQIDGLMKRLLKKERDARRYDLVRKFTQPRYLAGMLGVEWVDIPSDETIEQKIDELCDAYLSTTTQGGWDG